MTCCRPSPWRCEIVQRGKTGSWKTKSHQARYNMYSPNASNTYKKLFQLVGIFIIFCCVINWIICLISVSCFNIYIYVWIYIKYRSFGLLHTRHMARLYVLSRVKKRSFTFVFIVLFYYFRIQQPAIRNELSIASNFIIKVIGCTMLNISETIRFRIDARNLVLSYSEFAILLNLTVHLKK